MKILKWSFLPLLVAALAITVLAVSGCQERGTAASSGQAVKYTCPMHPEVVKTSPGNCPNCGMTLVPVSPPTSTATASGASHQGCCGQ